MLFVGITSVPGSRFSYGIVVKARIGESKLDLATRVDVVSSRGPDV